MVDFYLRTFSYFEKDNAREVILSVCEFKRDDTCAIRYEENPVVREIEA